MRRELSVELFYSYSLSEEVDIAIFATKSRPMSISILWQVHQCNGRGTAIPSPFQFFHLEGLNWISLAEKRVPFCPL